MAKKKQYKPKQKTKKANTSKIKHSAKPNIKQETDKGEEKISVSHKYIAAFVIAILSFIAYIPSLDNEFTNWDDNSYAAQNYQLEDLNWSKKTIFSILDGKLSSIGHVVFSCRF